MGETVFSRAHECMSNTNGYLFGMPNIELNEFEFGPDPTTDYAVGCPCASKRSMCPLFSRLLLTSSFFNLQVARRTCMTFSNCDQIGSLTLELAATER